MPEEAAASYRESIRLQPGHAEAHNNLAVALQAHGRLHEAITGFKEAIRLRPDYAQAHYNLAHAYLAAGNFERGWAEHEWRWACPSFAPVLLHTSRPVWDGSPLDGRTIFLHGEQGLGDTLQFIRYVPMGKARTAAIARAAAPVIRWCAAWGYRPLVADRADAAVRRPRAAVEPARIFGTTLANPGRRPLPGLPPIRRRPRGEELDGGSSFKVGIAWQGKPQSRETVGVPIPLAVFSPRWPRAQACGCSACRKDTAANNWPPRADQLFRSSTWQPGWTTMRARSSTRQR